MTQYITIPDNMNKYLWNLIEKYGSKKTAKEFHSKSFCPKYINNPDIIELLIKSQIIMTDKGMHFSRKDILEKGVDVEPKDIDWLVEFHRYNIDGSHIPDFRKHCDDHGGVSCNVNTIIYYLQKDPTVSGGNLIIYDKYNQTEKIEIVSVSKSLSQSLAFNNPNIYCFFS